MSNKFRTTDPYGFDERVLVVNASDTPVTVAGTVSISGGAGTTDVDIVGQSVGNLNVDVQNLPAVQPVSDNGASLTVDTSAGAIDVNVGNLPATQSTNLAQVGGAAVLTGVGAATGAQRVAVADGSTITANAGTGTFATTLNSVDPSLTGPQTTANSIAVALPSDQASIPTTVGNFPATQNVSLTSQSALATGLGAATGSTIRTTIVSDQTSIPVTASVTFPTTQDVNVSQVGGVAVVTGAGVATNAQRVAIADGATVTANVTFPTTQDVNQTQINGAAVLTGVGTAVGAQRVAVADGSTVTIQDGGNIITVDGTVTANVTFPSVQPVNDNSGSLTVDTDGGALSVTSTNLPASVDTDSGAASGNTIRVTQATDDVVTVDTQLEQGAGATTLSTARVVVANDQTLPVSGTVTANVSFPAVQSVDDNGASLTVDTALGALTVDDQHPVGSSAITGTEQRVILPTDHQDINVNVTNTTLAVDQIRQQTDETLRYLTRYRMGRDDGRTIGQASAYGHVITNTGCVDNDLTLVQQNSPTYALATYEESHLCGIPCLDFTGIADQTSTSNHWTWQGTTRPWGNGLRPQRVVFDFLFQMVDSAPASDVVLFSCSRDADSTRLVFVLTTDGKIRMEANGPSPQDPTNRFTCQMDFDLEWGSEKWHRCTFCRDDLATGAFTDRNKWFLDGVEQSTVFNIGTGQDLVVDFMRRDFSGKCCLGNTFNNDSGTLTRGTPSLTGVRVADLGVLTWDGTLDFDQLFPERSLQQALEVDAASRIANVGTMAPLQTTNGRLLVDACAGVASNNIAEVGGTTVSVNSGATDAGTIRVALADTQPTITVDQARQEVVPSISYLSHFRIGTDDSRTVGASPTVGSVITNLGTTGDNLVLEEYGAPAYAKPVYAPGPVNDRLALSYDGVGDQVDDGIFYAFSGTSRSWGTGDRPRRLICDLWIKLSDVAPSGDVAVFQMARHDDGQESGFWMSTAGKIRFDGANPSDNSFFCEMDVDLGWGSGQWHRCTYIRDDDGSTINARNRWFLNAVEQSVIFNGSPTDALATVLNGRQCLGNALENTAGTDTRGTPNLENVTVSEVAVGTWSGTLDLDQLFIDQKQLTTIREDFPSKPHADRGQRAPLLTDERGRLHVRPGALGPGEACSMTNRVVLSHEVLDQYNRIRIADTNTVFDSRFTRNARTVQWTDDADTGLSVSHTAPYITLQANAAAASGRAIKRTRRYFPYTDSKIFMAIINASLSVQSTQESMVSARVGVYDDDDGVYWELAGGVLQVVKRSSASGSLVTTTVTQANFNIDKLDGNGFSAVTIDPFKRQQFVIATGSGNGEVVMGINVAGQFIRAHQFIHGNSGSVAEALLPWSARQSLPIAAEIATTGSSVSLASMRVTSAALQIDGWEPRGRIYSHIRTEHDVATNVESSNSNDWRPVFAIRCKAASNKVSIRPLVMYGIGREDVNPPSCMALFHFFAPGDYGAGPIAAVDITAGGSWVDAAGSPSYQADSAVEYVTPVGDATAVRPIALDLATYPSAIIANAVFGDSLRYNIRDVVKDAFSGVSVAGNGDWFVLGIKNIDNQQKEVVGGLVWEELE